MGAVIKLLLKNWKCIGIWVFRWTRDLRFSQHIETQVNKANSLLGLIRWSYEHLDAEPVQLLFVALVRPHLEFGNVVWSPRTKKIRSL